MSERWKVVAFAGGKRQTERRLEPRVASDFIEEVMHEGLKKPGDVDLIVIVPED